jgi:hypothetical protein
MAAPPLADEAVDEDLVYDLAGMAGAASAVLGAALPAAAVEAPFCTPPWWLQAPFPPFELVPSLHVTVDAAVAPSAAYVAVAVPNPTRTALMISERSRVACMVFPWTGWAIEYPSMAQEC